MCLPAAALIAVSAGISAVGSIMQGAQAAEMGKLQQKAYNQQAEADQKASAFEQMRTLQHQEQLQSAARANIGASGVALQGSPTEALVANAREGALDIQAIQYGSTLRQNTLRTQGQIANYSGQQAQTASYFDAASNLVTGMSRLYDPNRTVMMGQNKFV